MRVSRFVYASEGTIQTRKQCDKESAQYATLEIEGNTNEAKCVKRELLTHMYYDAKMR